MTDDASISEYVTLVSSDGYQFVVKRSAACVSGALKRMLDPKSNFSEAIENKATLSNLNGVVLEKVCEYFYFYEKYKDSKDSPDMDIPPEMCLELLVAADYLNNLCLARTPRSHFKAPFGVMPPPSAVAPQPLAEIAPNPQLPDAESTTLRLTHPTFAEKQTTWKQNGHSWRGPLSMPAYLRREQRLSETSLTRNGGITHWVLVDTPYLPGGERRVLASCETIRKRALVAYRTTEGVKVEEAVSHGIGSVFCPKEYRGKGYAGRMMRELSKLLRGWQVEGAEKGGKCLFTVLYSDIGKSFYARLGWHPFASSHISLPPLSRDFFNMASVLPPSRELYAASLKELCMADERLLLHRLTTMGVTKRVHVALIPDLESMEYHHAREEFISHEVAGCEPSVKGAIVGEAEGQRSWCIWTRVYGNKDTTLYILRLVFEDEATEQTSLAHPTKGAYPTNGMPSEVKSKQVDAAASLLLAAQREASRWGMKDVQIWNPEPATLLASHRVLNLTAGVARTSGIEVVDREKESIASLMWYGESQQPELQGLQRGDIEWVGNEKYAWC